MENCMKAGLHLIKKILSQSVFFNDCAVVNNVARSLTDLGLWDDTCIYYRRPVSHLGVIAKNAY